MLNRSNLTWIALGGSTALLLGAFAFQYLGGLLPCVLCLYQRWPHGVAVMAGLLALRLGNPWLYVGALAAAVTSAIGIFHAGVELEFWAGLATCTVDTLKGIDSADLLNMNLAVGAPVRCDAVPWELFGVSMAGWNAIISAGLCAVWLQAVRRSCDCRAGGMQRGSELQSCQDYTCK